MIALTLLFVMALPLIAGLVLLWFGPLSEEQTRRH